MDTYKIKLSHIIKHATFLRPSIRPPALQSIRPSSRPSAPLSDLSIPTFDFELADFADDAGEEDSGSGGGTNDAADQRRSVRGFDSEQDLK